MLKSLSSKRDFKPVFLYVKKCAKKRNIDSVEAIRLLRAISNSLGEENIESLMRDFNEMKTKQTRKRKTREKTTAEPNSIEIQNSKRKKKTNSKDRTEPEAAVKLPKSRPRKITFTTWCPKNMKIHTCVIR